MNLIMPKGDGTLKMVLESLKILINKSDWVSNDEFKEEMSEVIKRANIEKEIGEDKEEEEDKEIDGPFLLKKSEIARYFGLVEHNFSQKKSRITEEGKKFYIADTPEKKIDVIFEILRKGKITFGRNSSGTKGSDSDLEVPILILKLLLSFPELSKDEISISIYLMNDKENTFLETLRKLIEIREYSKIEEYKNKIREEKLGNKYFDLKILVFYRELGIVDIKNNKYILKNEIIENYGKLINNFYEIKDEEYLNKRIYFCNKLKKEIPYNKIVYGAPGTGKSSGVKDETKKYFNKENIKRVTFYDGYTYGQFVGAYKPVMYNKNDSEKEIGYEFVEGPLLSQVLNAYKYPEQDFIIVIEEINRAKVDRVFGDIFQLLDRDFNGDSEYPISLSREQENYFKENLDEERYQDTIAEKQGLYLPNNLYIWATMNSADQGVYPMDTAFKRRWDFEYISLNKNKREEELFIEIDGVKYTWNDYREILNEILGEQGITEDRLISPYFLKETDFDEKKILKSSSYINKFLMYIFDDILKHNNRLKESLFTEKNFYKIFEKIQSENETQIYSTDFLERLKEKSKQVDDKRTEE